MDSSPQAALIHAYLDAYNRFDIEGMLAVLDDDVRFENFSGGELTVATDGIMAFRDIAQQAVALFSEREQRVTAIEEGDGWVKVGIAYRGVLRNGFPGGPGPGTVLELRGSSEFAFRDGKIAKIVDRS